MQYKIYPLDDYSQFGELLSHTQKSKDKNFWCFRHKKHYLDQLIYECDHGGVEDAFFNLYANKELIRQCYQGILPTPPPFTLDMYLTITQQKIKNRCYWYAVKILDGDKHINTVFIMILNKGNYYYTYGGKNHNDGWPKEIPEKYKSQIVYREMPPFIADELTDDNIITDNDGTIFVEGLPINDNGYYYDDNMYCVICNKLFIKTPFNVLNLKYCIDKLNQLITKYNIDEIEVIGNNSQLSNITNIRIGGVDINENILKLFKTQQSNIIRNKSTYIVELLYRWKTLIKC